MKPISRRKSNAVYFRKGDTKTIWTNFLLLFFMSLIPLATEPLGEHFYQKESHMFYGAVLAGVSLAYTLLQLNVDRLLTDVPEKDKRRVDRINWLATILYAASIPLSCLSIYCSTAIFILFPIIYFIPSKTLSRTAKID